MAEFQLTRAQAAAVAHRDSALLLSAGAGSGKTRVLVERLLSRIAGEGLDADRFLIITYTRAAASELRSRIAAALHERLGRDPASRHLRRQTLLLHRARIGTIHSLCAALLREYAPLLGLRPDFRQLEGAEESILRAEVLTLLLEEKYETMTEEFRALADTMGAGRDDRALKSVVLGTYEALQSHPDPERWLISQLAAPLPEGDAGETPWGALLLERSIDRVSFWRARMAAALESLGEDGRLEAAYGPSFRETVKSLEELEAALREGWDAAAACGEVRFPALKGFKGSGELPLAGSAKAVREECKAALKKIAALFDASSAEHREDLAAVKPVTDALLRLTSDFSAAYEREKRRRGLLDFSDLEHLALRLLTEEDRETPSPLARELSGRWEEILVDEYQDCNRVQDRLFFVLSRGGNNVTMVGDVKQSIYRFRLADPRSFLEKYAAYREEPRAGEGRRILLPENFRSDAGILRPVNAFFSAVMSPRLGELSYGEEEALRPGPGAVETEGAFRFFVLPEGEDRLSAEAEAVADYVSFLLRGGFPLPDGAGERPAKPGDIAILLRSAKGKDEVFADALKKRGIAAFCPKSTESLSARPEVRWALSLLQIIDNPRQDIPLLAALRSPVFCFSEDRLAQIRCFEREGDYYAALQTAAETEADCRSVLDWLSLWRLRSQLIPAEGLLRELCAETALPALAESREAGSSRNLDALLEEARRFGETGRSDLMSFLHYLRSAEGMEQSALTAAPGGGEGVTITTIHASKGLEWPVVILADLMKKFNREDVRKPLLIHPELGVGAKRADRVRGIEYPTLPRLACAQSLTSESLSEELRVLYVAMTRPRNHLALFLGLKEPEKAREKYRWEGGAPLPPELLESASGMGEWLLRASLVLGGEDWAWRSPPGPGETPEAAAAAPEARKERAEGVDALLNWRYPHEADTRLPSKLTATALRATFASQEAAEGAGELSLPPTGERELRPLRFARGEALDAAGRGTAVHLAMQYADLSECDTLAGARRALERLREKRILTDDQYAAVDEQKLVDFCRSREMALLRQGEVHREFKFSLLAPVRQFLGEGEGETLLQGVVDLWSELPEGLVLLDYKTDRVTWETQTARALEYEPQLRAYAWALEQITGKKVLKKLVWFFATGESVEVP
ncbi:MAG: UvrD-helicase domain-containing protein [Oscillospiraceae bacterium]|nr:UvrD-helicase domain-containing protein [Oscillospiraceae bacterium]